MSLARAMLGRDKTAYAKWAHLQPAEPGEGPFECVGMGGGGMGDRGHETAAASPRAFDDPAVAAAFASFPEAVRPALARLRTLIFDVAESTPAIGPVFETLKWGQPAYLTPVTKAGSTIRLGVPKQGGYALYTHCRTTLLVEFRDIFPGRFSYDGNRAILFADGDVPPVEELGTLVRNALTYHRRR